MAKSAGKLSTHTTNAINAKYLGQEPEFKANVIKTDSEMIRAYTWYSTTKNVEDARKYLCEYLSGSPEKIAAVEQIADHQLNKTMGWIARLLTQGTIIPAAASSKFNHFINSLELTTKVKKTRERNERDRLSDYIPDFETAVDAMDPEFSAYAYLTANSVPQSYANRIAQYYAPQAREMIDAAKRTDPQLVEGYRHMKYKDLVLSSKYLMMIVADCERFVGNVKKVRKPRKTKVRTDQDKLKLFNYMKSHDQMKLASINPQSILGASQLFSLNTSNNVLTMFIAKAGGLSVHRSSISNYDEKLTKSKRVGKKVQQVLNIINLGNKKSRTTVLDTVSSEYIKSTDRINTSTILVKAFK